MRYKSFVNRAHRFFVLAMAASWALTGCGGGGATATEGLSISPATLTLEVDASKTFTAIPSGGISRVTWSATGGTINSAGDYVAPSTPGTYQVNVAVSDNPAIKATSVVTVVPAISIAINPPTGTPAIIPFSTYRFSANILNATDPTVKWEVDGGIDSGTIDQNGVYTAPNRTGTFTVVARSKQNPAKFSRYNVNVVATAKAILTIEGLGNVEITLNTGAAPRTSANIVSLVNKGFYDGVIFHRFEDLDPTAGIGQIIQGGDPLTKTLPLTDPSIGTGGPGYTIDFETNALLHDQWSVAMARSSERNSGGSQFYFCLEPCHFLDGNYVVFGAITGGQSVAAAMNRGSKITSAVTAP